MNTRAKLVCTKVDRQFSNAADPNQITQETVLFQTRYNQKDSKEDNTFSIFTPSGNCTLVITNPDLFGSFEENKAYYFDIAPAF